MKHLTLIILFVILFVSLLLFWWTQEIKKKPEPQAENKMYRIEVYVYEDENDPDNINKIHVGDITNKGGKLELSIITEGEDALRLQKDFAEIISRKSLLLKVDIPKKFMGIIYSYVLTGIDVSPDPNNSEYIYAIARALNGFMCDVEEDDTGREKY